MPDEYSTVVSSQANAMEQNERPEAGWAARYGLYESDACDCSRFLLADKHR